MTEERREREVAPEVAAAQRLLKEAADKLARLASDPESSTMVVGVLVESVQRWLAVLRHPRPRDAFWKEVHNSFNVWVEGVRERLDDGDIVGAVEDARAAVRNLQSYAGFLGVELPPEVEEAPVDDQSATPLERLGLSPRVYNALGFGLTERGLPPTIEAVMSIYLEEGGQGLRDFKNVGPVALEEIMGALKEKDFLAALGRV